MFKRGDVYEVELPEDKTSRMQGGRRPIVILSNDLNNKHSEIIQFAPLTAQLKKLNLPVHVVVSDRILKKQSVVLLEQLEKIDKNKLIDITVSKIGQLSEESMNRVSIGAAAQLGINISSLYFMIQNTNNLQIAQ